jgi:hypothetical protein
MHEEQISQQTSDRDLHGISIINWRNLHQNNNYFFILLEGRETIRRIHHLAYLHCCLMVNTLDITYFPHFHFINLRCLLTSFTFYNLAF